MFRSDFRGLSQSFKYILLHSSYTSLNMRIMTINICRDCLVDVMWFSCGFSGGFPRFSGGFPWAKGSVHDSISPIVPSLRGTRIRTNRWWGNSWSELWTRAECVGKRARLENTMQRGWCGFTGTGVCSGKNVDFAGFIVAMKLVSRKLSKTIMG